jgi:DNA-binding XRE family transcriptional regulator
MKKPIEHTCCKLLGLPQNSSHEEIEKAFRKTLDYCGPASNTRGGLDVMEALRCLRKIRDEYWKSLRKSPRRTLPLRPQPFPWQGACPDTPFREEQFDAWSASQAGEACSSSSNHSSSHASHTSEDLSPVSEVFSLATDSPRTSPEVPNESDTVFCGKLLRTIRESQGLSASDMVERIKISPTNLANIEADRYRALPATVYLRGFLITIARELKLDPLRVTKSYLDLVSKELS